ncbi:hypothetical protein [Streptomyces sp. CBMA152]|uniref:hypothetical protein n=1 Tax=Streptomyces sp. CBMA152 TaxID=1896312 RepID=UPI001660EE52|nr:hypothetical protein [Streptomyces sp. CBMA152]MBD0743521.1 hypothetical protein [Streptomyces sp. CBMA152]
MTITITAWPAHTTTPIPAPLPRLGRCADCPGEIRIRNNGRLYAHHCTGDGTVPLLALRPTFARWLWTQSKRRDDYTNLLTLFAGGIFRPCTCTPPLTARDVTWQTAAQLHDGLHHQQLARAGTEVRNPSTGERCDSRCGELQIAARAYEELLAAARTPT